MYSHSAIVTRAMITETFAVLTVTRLGRWADQPVLPLSNRSTEQRLLPTTCLRSSGRSTRRREWVVCKADRAVCTNRDTEPTRRKVHKADKIRTLGIT